MEKRLKRVLSKIFEMDEGEITRELTPERVVLWDSLHHLKMVTEIESVFEVRLTMKEIRSMTTFGRVQEVVESHLEEINERMNGTPVQGKAIRVSSDQDGE